MPEPGADRLVPRPDVGRTFEATRRARFGDLDPRGRLRFDALARFLQDVSSDDTSDAGLDNDVAWVVRRTAIALMVSPRFRELLTLTTFCSGTGGRWAERRVSVTGDRGAAIEAVSLWVHLDPRSGKPLRLPVDFHASYDTAARGRHVSARLQHLAEVPADAARQPWPVRATDFDLLGHMNNAATWSVVEDVLASRPHLRVPLWAELEYRAAIEPGDRVELATTDLAGRVGPAGGRAAPVVRHRPPPPALRAIRRSGRPRDRTGAVRRWPDRRPPR
jgi:acyl-ACP thioesterase